MLTSKRGQFSIGRIVSVVIGITATIADLLNLLLIVGGVILVVSLYIIMADAKAL